MDTTETRTHEIVAVEAPKTSNAASQKVRCQIMDRFAYRA
jgi:hypothetical protein